MIASRLTIAQRLGLSFGFITLLMLAMTWLSIDRVNGMNASLTRINDVNSVKQRHAINFRGSVHDRAIAIRDVVLLPEAQRGAAIALIDRLAEDYAANERALARMLTQPGVATPTGVRLLEQIEAVQARTNPLVGQVIALQQGGDAAGAMARLAEVRPLFDEWLDAINAFIDYHEDSNQTIGAEVRATAAGFQTLALSALAAALLLALVAAVLVARSISVPILGLVRVMRVMAGNDYRVTVPHTGRRDEIGTVANTVEVFRTALIDAQERQQAQLAESDLAARKAEEDARRQARVVQDISAGLQRLAAGDLTGPIGSPADDPFPAEYDQLRQSYNEVIERLGEIVARISSVASAVRRGADDIDHAARNLSNRTETQAVTLEQSSAALTELAQSVHSTSGQAGKGEEAGRCNSEQAQSGAQVVREAIEAMRAVERSSAQMTRIIGVIDDIAFQTNLLALNAGVEAARAGDAGRGFAVVASEVRGLAQRASDSAREIKELISDSTDQVENSSHLVGQTGARLEEILLRAREVQDLMIAIAGATREQSAGLGEISEGVSQLDQMTQQNAALAAEATATASSLTERAGELVEVLGHFRTRGASVHALPGLREKAARAEADARPARASAGGVLREF